MAANRKHGKSADSTNGGGSDDGLDWELEDIGCGSNTDDEVLAKLVVGVVDALETGNRLVVKQAQKGLSGFRCLIENFIFIPKIENFIFILNNFEDSSMTENDALLAARITSLEAQMAKGKGKESSR
jgi:hypothetical protein